MVSRAAGRMGSILAAGPLCGVCLPNGGFTPAADERRPRGPGRLKQLGLGSILSPLHHHLAGPVADLAAREGAWALGRPQASPLMGLDRWIRSSVRSSCTWGWPWGPWEC